MTVRISAFVTGFTTVLFILGGPQQLLRPYMFSLSSTFGISSPGFVSPVPPLSRPAAFATGTTSSLQLLPVQSSTTLSKPTSQWLCSGLAPQPFAENTSERLEVYAKGDSSRKDSTRKTQKIFDALQQVGAQECSSILRLVEDGLTWNQIGMDFSAVQRKRGRLEMRKEVLESLDNDMRLVMKLYCASPKVVAADHFLRHRERDLSALRFADRQQARQLHETGYLSFDNFGVDMDRLQAEANAVWSGTHTHVKVTKLESIEALLTNKAILELASFYMGAEVKLNGYKLFRIGRKTTSGSYFSGLWHHDSCGRRLKLLIYLQDVGEDGAPTEIASGSHSTSFYHIGESGTNRFSNSLVQNQYKVEKMIGRRGGGFIFDTNSVHRGYVDGVARDSERDVVIIDFTGKFPGHMSCEEQNTFLVRNIFPFPDGSGDGSETEIRTTAKPSSPSTASFLGAKSSSKLSPATELADAKVVMAPTLAMNAVVIVGASSAETTRRPETLSSALSTADNSSALKRPTSSLKVFSSTMLSMPKSPWLCSGEAPQPFSEDVTERLNVFSRKDGSRKESTRRTQKILDRLKEAGPETCVAIRRLVQDGLTWNEIGLDFSGVGYARGDLEVSNKPWDSLDEDIRNVMQLYCAAAKGIGADHLLRHRSRDFGALQYADHQKAKSFYENGFIQFEDFGLDMDLLQAEAQAVFTAPPKTQTKAAKLSSIEPLLHDKAISELASFYMGSSVKLKGYKLFRIGRTLTSSQYFSGLWHHDSCGRRLKVFIYLQDVGDDGAPTEIALGSHSTSYYHPGSAGCNRFSNALVEDQYKVQKMKGRRGGGFIFDTNSVHRGFVDGGKRDSERDVVIVDFAGEFPEHTSCTEQSTFPVDQHFAFPGTPSKPDKRR